MKINLIDTLRFKHVMHVIYALAILTNICVASLLLYLSAYNVLFSPLIGSVLFTIGLVLMRKDILTVKQTFLFTAYTVVIEVIIHTHYLGWDAGFYYFLYGLAIAFLLDFSWKIRSVLLFNGSIILFTIITALVYKNRPGEHTVSTEFLDIINNFNQVIVAIVILVITIYFSYNNKNKDEALHEANLELGQQNKEILEQRDHLEILLKEVHHRVKNNLQIISSLLSLQQRAVEDEKVYSILDQSRSRVEAIALIHHNLYNNNKGSQVDFNAYLNELVNSQQIIQSEINCQVNCSHVILDLDLAVPLGLITSEMITNSLKHAFHEVEDPRIEISFYKEDDQFELIYRDNGVGLPKGFNLDQGKTLGVEIISALVAQVDGSIVYNNDDGAVFVITI